MYSTPTAQRIHLKTVPDTVGASEYMAAPQQFGDLFSEAATGFMVTDVRGYIVHANEAFARMVGRVSEEIPKANLSAWTHPDDQMRHQRLIQQLLSGAISGFVIEMRYLRPDGSFVWVRNSVSLVSDEQQQPGHLISISEDISDRKRAEQVLEQQEQLANVGRLTSSIIHEINNPLEAVTNLLYLARHASASSGASAYLRQAEDELRRASEITSQGLLFHRQSSSAVPTAVADVMQSVLLLFKGRLREARVEVAFIRGDAPQLMCFAGEMRQVFVNLIANAIEAMPGGGQLTIRVRRGNDWHTGEQAVRVTLGDTGVGISPETQKRMYDAFVTTKGSRGSGLGLWVTSKIVRKHQGYIRVRSRQTGKSRGTVFSLVFPCRGAHGRSPGFQSDAA